MGRYDGEEYEVVPACRPSDHQFGVNGTCHVCRRNRDSLRREAKETLGRLGDA